MQSCHWLHEELQPRTKNDQEQWSRNETSSMPWKMLTSVWVCRRLTSSMLYSTREDMISSWVTAAAAPRHDIGNEFEEARRRVATTTPTPDIAVESPTTHQQSASAGSF